LQHSQATFTIAPDLGVDIAAQRIWFLLELAQRKQERIG
jgi:hypothetical protein